MLSHREPHAWGDANPIWLLLHAAAGMAGIKENSIAVENNGQRLCGYKLTRLPASLADAAALFEIQTGQNRFRR